MAKVNVFFAEGTEEVEALTVVDILRRAKIDTEMVSTTGDIYVTGSHGITVKMDKLIADADDSADMIVLPGGIPGVPNLLGNKQLNDIIYKYDKTEGKYLAAICAAPTIYGRLGLLKGKKATCYPGMEDGLLEAAVSYDSVVKDGKYITSRGLGTAIEFALAIVEALVDKKTADELSEKIVY